MNKIFLFAATLSLSVAVVAPAVVHADSTAVIPSRSYSCGPYMDTYSVRSLDNAPGTGVRCVKWSDGSLNNPKVPVFAWYGEGDWRGYNYRHVGQAYIQNKKTPSVLRGYASDIFGNGEATQGDYHNLTVTVLGRDKIQVTGGWDEEWTRVTSMDYQPLPTIQDCGPYFDQYLAFSQDVYKKNASTSANSSAGSGLRCVMKTGPRSTTWYGVGDWDGKSYSHLATGSTKGYGAADFCVTAGDFCNDFSFGSILLRASKTLRLPVVDGWGEVWVRQRPAYNY